MTGSTKWNLWESARMQLMTVESSWSNEWVREQHPDWKAFPKREEKRGLREDWEKAAGSGCDCQRVQGYWSTTQCTGVSVFGYLLRLLSRVTALCMADRILGLQAANFLAQQPVHPATVCGIQFQIKPQGTARVKQRAAQGHAVSLGMESPWQWNIAKRRQFANIF